MILSAFSSFFFFSDRWRRRDIRYSKLLELQRIKMLDLDNKQAFLSGFQGSVDGTDGWDWGLVGWGPVVGSLPIPLNQTCWVLPAEVGIEVKNVWKS